MGMTEMILTAGFIILGIYDFIVVTRTGVGSSISRAMQRAGFRSPTVCLVIGYVLGHIFGYMPPEISTESHTLVGYLVGRGITKRESNDVTVKSDQ